MSANEAVVPRRSARREPVGRVVTGSPQRRWPQWTVKLPLNQPDRNRRSLSLPVGDGLLGRLQTDDLVVVGLWRSPPCAEAKDALHGVEGRFDQVVEIPAIVDRFRDRGP